VNKFFYAITFNLVTLMKLLTFVVCLFSGLALQNKNRGIYISRNTDTMSKTKEPDLVAFGHLNVEASIIPM
jgi:hypothetical protein